jgi:hypothetical protein
LTLSVLVIKMKEGSWAAASSMMLHRRKGRKTKRLTLFHLMMKLKSPVLLGRRAVEGPRAVEHDLQWCLMAAAIHQMV